VNIKQIVIALIDRLAAYAAREAENDDPEETKRQEEAASKRLAERVKSMRLSKASNTTASSEMANNWASSSHNDESTSQTSNGTSKSSEKGKEKEDSSLKKFRGIPEDVKLFEVFWQQIVALIKVCFYF
jgi:vacuolar protein sorting-associated protein 35